MPVVLAIRPYTAVVMCHDGSKATLSTYSKHILLMGQPLPSTIMRLKLGSCLSGGKGLHNVSQGAQHGEAMRTHPESLGHGRDIAEGCLA